MLHQSRSIKPYQYQYQLNVNMIHGSVIFNTFPGIKTRFIFTYHVGTLKEFSKKI